MVQRFPAFDLHLDDLTVCQHPVKHLLCRAIWLTTPPCFTRTFDSRQSAAADFLFDQKAISLSLTALANKVHGRDLFGQGIHTFEAVTMMRHDFACAPKIIQCKCAVLPPTITLGPCARRH